MANSRPHKKQPAVWRRRTCTKCLRTFTTSEQPSLDGTPIHHEEQFSPFNIGRLTVSIATAFAHAPEKGSEHAYWLARSIEAWLVTEHSHITSHDIEAVTHQTLQRFDSLAAVQYAAQHRMIVS